MARRSERVQQLLFPSPWKRSKSWSRSTPSSFVCAAVEPNNGAVQCSQCAARTRPEGILMHSTVDTPCPLVYPALLACQCYWAVLHTTHRYFDLWLSDIAKPMFKSKLPSTEQGRGQHRHVPGCWPGQCTAYTRCFPCCLPCIHAVIFVKYIYRGFFSDLHF